MTMVIILSTGLINLIFMLDATGYNKLKYTSGKTDGFFISFFLSLIPLPSQLFSWLLFDLKRITGMKIIQL